MLAPIKIVVKQISAIKMYVHDFPVSFAAKFLVKMGTKIEALAKLLLHMKGNIGLSTKVEVKKAHLKMKAAPEVKPALKIQGRGKLFLKGSCESKGKIDCDVTPSGRYRIVNSNIKPSIKMSVSAKSLIFYKNYERSTQTWAEVFADDTMNTNATFLYREV